MLEFKLRVIKKKGNERVMRITKKKAIILSSVVVAVIVIIAGVSVFGKKPKNDLTTLSQTDFVTVGDVEETITGSAAIEPLERYEIIALVSGDIVASPYDVGDTVQEGDLLYRFDTSSASLGIEKQELSLEQSKNSYNNAVKEAQKLTITAPCNGVVSGIEVKVGKDVSQSTVLANIENTYELTVDLPFNETQVQNIYVGDSATVSSSLHMSSVEGYVSHVAANPTAQTDGSRLYNVTIKINNPGSFTAGLVVGGEVKGMISPGGGTIKCEDSEKVSPEVAGTVNAVYVKNGDYVNKGDVLMTLESDTVTNNIKNSSIQYKNSTLSLQESRDSLDDYNITSPISGTVITRNKKAGDTIDRNNATEALMVVADISKLKFVLSIDELDIDKVEIGQDVKITCDALEGEEYMGKITNVSVEGTSTNGVTVYEAEVVVDEPGNLRPSMNVDATVVFAASKDTLVVPTGDVKTVMGKSYLFVKDSSEDGEKKNEKQEALPVVGLDKEIKDDEDKIQPEREDGGKDARIPEAPQGYKAVEVTIGLSNDEYTEILSGVEEGDEIYRIATDANGSGAMSMMGGMMSGMGGAPGGMGGAPGGMGGAPGGMGGGR